jgi:hypothetical protein
VVQTIVVSHDKSMNLNMLMSARRILLADIINHVTIPHRSQVHHLVVQESVYLSA